MTTVTPGQLIVDDVENLFAKCDRCRSICPLDHFLDTSSLIVERDGAFLGESPVHIQYVQNNTCGGCVHRAMDDADAGE